MIEEGEILKPRKKVVVASFGPPRDASRDSQRVKSKVNKAKRQVRNDNFETQSCRVNTRTFKRHESHGPKS